MIGPHPLPVLPWVLSCPFRACGDAGLYSVRHQDAWPALRIRASARLQIARAVPLKMN